MKVVLHRLFTKSRLDNIAFVIVFIALLATSLSYRVWKAPDRVIAHDVVLYYQYLPTVFIYKDLSMSFTKTNIEFFRDKIWTNSTKVGRTMSKMTMGTAVLYSPFFFPAHWLAKPLGYPADGYSLPYRIALAFSSIFYAMAGLFLLMKLLRKYFDRMAVAITVLAIGLGTNLYFYTNIDPAMSHAYSFCLFAAFILLTDKWIARPGWLVALGIGISGGLIILVRPSNGIIFIILLLWQVDSFAALKSRFVTFLRQWPNILLMVAAVIIVALPQMLYWKYSTGQYIYYGYREERFFFNDPEIFKGLFSYRKGWLVYTPVMAFAMFGLGVMYVKMKKLFWPVLVFTLLNFYVVWSWWCWWYGGGFGQRTLIESYALLAIPLAASVDFFLKKNKPLRFIFSFLIGFFIILNIFQTYQYTRGIIHWDGMTKKAYWDTYVRFKISPAHYNQISEPDYQAAMNGDR